MIKLVLFDLDGVLLDAREAHYEALNTALELRGHKPIPLWEHESRFNGLPTKKKLEMLGVMDPEVPRLKQEITLEMLKVLQTPSKAELMELPCLIGVCTNAVRATLDVGLQRCAVAPDFSLSNEDVVRNKPDPEIYLIAMELAGVKPSETVIFEDSDVGFEAAKKSLAWAVMVPGVHDVTKRSVDEFVRSCAGGWCWTEVPRARLSRSKASNPVSRQDDDRACSGEHKTQATA